MVFEPPRHGKSEHVSRRLPAFILGRDPNAKVVAASYSADLAQAMNRDVRRIMESRQYQELFPDTRLPSDSDTGYVKRAHTFDILNAEGSYRSVGIGGPLSGHGSSHSLIDDPVKNARDAASPTYRNAIWDWYQSVLLTRMEKNDSILITLTRWHNDDLAGRLLELSKSDPQADQWDVVSFPAIRGAELNPDDPRREGEALWPWKFPVDRLAKIKASVGSRVWESLYQQRPTALEGGYIKRSWIKYYKVLPAKFDEQIQSWDMSFKGSDTSDFVVGQVWGRIGSEKFLIYQIRERMGFGETIQAVQSLTALHPQAHAKLVEGAANGPAVVNALRKKISGLIEIRPEGSKESRLSAVTPEFEAGNVYFPDPSLYPWVRNLVEEVCTFPNAPNDDQCLIAGTMIATSQGDKPIENIVAGDLVFTPSGLRRVIQSGCTGVSQTITKWGVTGTAAHPVFQYGVGFIQMDASAQGVLNQFTWNSLARWIVLKQWCLTVLPSVEWEGKDATTLVSRLPTPKGNWLRVFMLLSGRLLTRKRYAKAIAYTISTVTRLITTLVTLSLYRIRNITNNILLLANRLLDSLSIWSGLGRSLSDGISRLMALNGTDYTPKNLGLAGFQAERNVSSVRNDLSHSAQQSTVPSIAVTKAAPLPESTISKPSVSGAVTNSPQLKGSTQVDSNVHVRAVAQPNGVNRVYNITVEGEHQYYANGILVGNCDSLSQALSRFCIAFSIPRISAL